VARILLIMPPRLEDTKVSQRKGKTRPRLLLVSRAELKLIYTIQKNGMVGRELFIFKREHKCIFSLKIYKRSGRKNED